MSLTAKILFFVRKAFVNICLTKSCFASLTIGIVLLLELTNLRGLPRVHRTINASIPKLRFAHCITGTPRTLHKEEVYTAYKHQALNVLSGDLFMVLQLVEKRELIHGILVEHRTPRFYAIALKYLSPRTTEWIPANKTLGAYETRSGYAKWQRCLEHIQEAEKIDGVKYDFIVRSRPDLYFAKALPQPYTLPNDRILINPYYECLYDIPSGYNHKWSKNFDLCDLKNYGISDRLDFVIIMLIIDSTAGVEIA